MYLLSLYDELVFGLVGDFEIPLLLREVFAQTPVAGACMTFHAFDARDATALP